MASQAHQAEFEPERSNSAWHALDGDTGRLVEGFFPPQLEEVFLRGNPVVSREPLESDRSRHGKTELEIITLENGRHYEVVTGIPKRQRSDIAVFVGTALATSIRGHNWHTMLNLMDIGYPTVMIGPEGGHARWPKTPTGWRQFMRNLLNINLAETSENMHEILDITDHDGHYMPRKIIKTGESRDAGVTMGFNARAHKFNREVIYSDAIAPCFPDPKPIAVNRQAIGRLTEIGVQVSSLTKNSVSLDPVKALHYLKTINPNPHFAMHVVGTVPTLVSGKAGRLAREIPHDAKIHNTHFSNDPWTNAKAWMDIFDGYDFVTHDLRPGDHGGIVRPETQQARLKRLRGLLEELVSNHHQIDRINWHNVHLLGQVAVAA